MQCHTHPKVKDGPKRRRETPAVRARAVSSTSASSPYPIIKEQPRESHSTPTHTSATMTTSAQQYVGLPTSLPPITQPTHVFPTLHTTHTDIQPKPEPVVGMFASPLQSFSRFEHHHTPHLTHQISEPELVGIKTTSSFNNLAGMI
jgi:hypothetical protein